MTQNTQQALSGAQAIALKQGHQSIDLVHFLLAILDQPDGLGRNLISRAGADPDAIQKRLLTRLGGNSACLGRRFQPG